MRIAAVFENRAVNFTGALVSAIAEAWGLASSAPPRWLIPAAFAATVFFLGRIAWSYHSEASRMRADLAPKFDIRFEPSDAYPDSRPYLQVMTFGEFRNGAGFPMSEMKDRRYRVGVVNLSKGIVPSVKLILSRCSPCGNFIHVGHRLLVMDSDPPVGERDLPPSVGGEPTLWFDVVNECDHASDVPEFFFFCYANPAIRGPITHDLHQHAGDDYSFEITLRAEGGGYQAERTFLISKGWGKSGRKPLKMKPL